VFTALFVVLAAEAFLTGRRLTDPLLALACALVAIWELPTLAAAWHHAYGGQRPDPGRALEFYDRWLPGTMRRIDSMTRGRVPNCVMRRRW